MIRFNDFSFFLDHHRKFPSFEPANLALDDRGLLHRDQKDLEVNQRQSLSVLLAPPDCLDHRSDFMAHLKPFQAACSRTLRPGPGTVSIAEPVQTGSG